MHLLTRAGALASPHKKSSLNTAIISPFLFSFLKIPPSHERYSCYNSVMDKLLQHFKDTSVDIQNIIKAQDIAKACLKHMASFLKPGMDRETIHKECADYMTLLGAQGWWIHNDPALILFGELTSYSGHEDPSYLFEGKTIQNNDLISIDVAPMIEKGWGDMARSFIMEEGKIISYKDTRNKEIKEGMETEMKLHELFLQNVNEKTTFSQVYEFTNAFLKKHGYHNCDYHDNFAHSIENDERDRITFAKGVDLIISEYNKPVTYEPHICKNDRNTGFKHENMYVFIDGKMKLL